MILLLDIGNSNTHAGLAGRGRVLHHETFATGAWLEGAAEARLRRWVGRRGIEGCALASVVPKVTARARRVVAGVWGVGTFVLNARTVPGVGVNYPHPETIGPDRLANALAARCLYGFPVVVVDFGTAVTFDVVDGRGDYAGGIIAPGLSAMTEYLHEKTALLPRVSIREVRAVIGKNTEEAMLIGAVRGYRGLVRELIGLLQRELQSPNLPVVATGGYARLIAAKMPEISAVNPLLTLEGLRRAWHQTAAERALRLKPLSPARNIRLP